MALQIEHTLQHYKRYYQRHGKVSKIATTAFLYFTADPRTTGKSTVYQNASWYK